MRFVLRVTSRRRQVDSDDGFGSWFDEDGEEMDGFDESTAPRHHSDPPEYIDPGGRLSRDLEQGFMDDSDDEVHDERQLHGRNTQV